MIETPRTDAELHGIKGIYVEADFARELERELNHAKEQRDEAIRIANGLLRLTDHLSSYDSSKDALEEELEKLKLDVS